MSNAHHHRVGTGLKTFCAFIKGTGTLFLYELLEEGLEELITLGITTVAAKAMSFFVLVLLVNTTKITAKGLAKGLMVVLKPVVKKFVYKEGNDKLKKLQSIIRRIFKMDEKEIVEAGEKKATFKELFHKLTSFLKRNKKTNTATFVNLITSAVSGAATVASFLYGKVSIPEWSIYLIGCIVVVIVFTLQELGIVGKGMETQEEYDERKQKEADKKAAAKAEEERLARELAEKNELKEALAKELQDAEAARLEVERAEQERIKAQEEAIAAQAKLDKINNIKVAYQVAVQNGYTGTINDFIDGQLG